MAGLTNIDVLNTIWANASTNYQDRIPQATRDNITAVADAIINYDVAKNEALNALVNRIALVIVSSKMMKNRLSPFKRGMLEYGSDIEEIFTSMVDAQPFNSDTAEAQVFKKNNPTVDAIFHRVNREDFYKVTVRDRELRRAFLSNDGMGKLVSSIVNTLYSSDQYDEWILMKELFNQYASRGDVTIAQELTPQVIDQASAKTFVQAVKQVSTDMTFPSTKFNAKGVRTWTERSDQILFLHKNVNVQVDVDLLSSAFNKGEFDYNTQVVILDDFGSLADTQAVLVDRQWFQVYDTLFETKSLYNPEGLYTNYWLHHWQILSTSLFNNCVAFQFTAA